MKVAVMYNHKDIMDGKPLIEFYRYDWRFKLGDRFTTFITCSYDMEAGILKTKHAIKGVRVLIEVIEI